ncbi:SAC3 GANP domain [Cryptosporidium sp. chipmunk genotype I]|uniref:SAC3 GANP domain n=1 Tax=Cryptosporidium sp. chipmunk genotype I TaxID=1280935 RepID=UPI00351A4F20|nr:SAC3 GANP domain [Cryptosporidium sp. chipmunk genotype I]
MKLGGILLKEALFQRCDSALFGAFFFVVGSVVSKLSSFALNIYLAKKIDPELFGIGFVSIALITNLSQSLNKKCFRRVALSESINSSKDENLCHVNLQSSINICWLSIISTCILSLILSLIWIANPPSSVFLDHGLVRQFKVSVILAGFSSIVESISEPLVFNLIKKEQVFLRSIIEILSGTSKSVLLVSIVMFKSSNLDILYYSIGQFIYSSVFLSLTFFACFKTFGQSKDIIVLPTSLGTSSKPQFFLKNHKSMLKQQIFASIQSTVLQETDKILVLHLFSAKEWSDYGVISNLANIVTRVLFAPIEEIATERFKEVKLDPNHSNSMTHLQAKLAPLRELLFFSTSIGLLAICFGPPISKSLISLLFGQNWRLHGTPDKQWSGYATAAPSSQEPRKIFHSLLNLLVEKGSKRIYFAFVLGGLIQRYLVHQIGMCPEFRKFIRNDFSELLASKSDSEKYMNQQNPADRASLITGFRVGGKAIRGWNQSNTVSQSSSLQTVSQEVQDIQNQNASTQGIPTSTQKSIEDWYKAHYYDYYFKAYKANGLDDATSSQYAHSCVNELERTGYIQNVIQAQSEMERQPVSNSMEFREQKKRQQRNSVHVKEVRQFQNSSNPINKSKGLQNWIYRLFSTYRSNGTSKEDIEWNQKLSTYSQHISERYRNSNKVIDWDLQNLPKREVIQNFKLKAPEQSEDLNSTIEALSSSPNVSNLVPFSSKRRFSPQPETELKRDEANSSSYVNEKSFSSLKSKRMRESNVSDQEKDLKHNKHLKQRKQAKNTENCIGNEEVTPLYKTESGLKTFSFYGQSSNHINSVSTFDFQISSNVKSGCSEENGYILDANGNKRLSWQQILALGKSTEKIVGLSNALEKQYLRLTSSPDPNLVRPEHILKKSLEFVYNNYLNYYSSQGSLSNQKQKKYDWKYLEEQFRSIRQDLTVQGIKNLFTIQVYELNARVALENHDLGQFNQCQARLKELYSLGIVEFEGSNREEFLCYYIIYVTLQNMKADLIRVLDEAQPFKSYKGISFAIQVCKAIIEGNYCRYFKLCKKAPWKSRFLFEIFRNRQLIVALTTMTKAFRFIEISVITSSLGFESNLDCHTFLTSQKAVFTHPNSSINELKLDCKASFAVFSSSPLLLNRKVQALG